MLVAAIGIETAVKAAFASAAAPVALVASCNAKCAPLKALKA